MRHLLRGWMLDQALQPTKDSLEGSDNHKYLFSKKYLRFSSEQW
jgi:hypothetical protein